MSVSELGSTAELHEADDGLHQAATICTELETDADRYRGEFYLAMLGERQALEGARRRILDIHSAALNFEETWREGLTTLPLGGTNGLSSGAAFRETDEALAVANRASGVLGACIAYCQHYEDACAENDDEDVIREARRWRHDVNRVLGKTMVDGTILDRRLARLTAGVQVRLARRLEVLTYLIVCSGIIAALIAIVHDIVT